MASNCHKISFSHGAFHFYLLKAGSIVVPLFPKNVVKRKHYNKSFPSNWFHPYFHFKFIVGEILEKSDLEAVYCREIIPS